MDSGWIGDDRMTKILYTKESARKLWTEARDKYQNQLDSKTRKNVYENINVIGACQKNTLSKSQPMILQGYPMDLTK